MKSRIGAILFPALLAVLVGQAAAQAPDAMAEHHQMMTQHQEIGKIIDRLLESSSAMENEKDPVLLRKELAEHGALLKELQSKFQENSKMMGMSMMGTMNMSGQSSTHPMSMEHAEHTMGFSQTQTTHHFLLRKNGGVIQVEANAPSDVQSRDQIRTHLSHIAKAFAAGDFSDPMSVHDQVPAGVPVLQRLKADLHYMFEETPQGGRVVIETKNPEALKAVHEFLRFQIHEHQTGDTGKIK
jgi:hypothetical protein